MNTEKPTKRVKAGRSEPQRKTRIALFISAYIANGGNGTQAAIAAGYSPSSARNQACRLLKNEYIMKQVQQNRDDMVAKASTECGLTVERVLKEVARLAFSDIGKIIGPDGKVLLPHQLDDDTRAAVSSFEIDENGRIKYKFWDKTSSHERAMKKLGLFKEDNSQRVDPLAALLERASGHGFNPVEE